MLEEPTQQPDPAPAVLTVPAAAPNKIVVLLQSRKFWAALIGLALIIIKAFRPDFPIQDDQLTGIVVVLVGYILGTSIEDSAHPTPPKVS